MLTVPESLRADAPTAPLVRGLGKEGAFHLKVASFSRASDAMRREQRRSMHYCSCSSRQGPGQEAHETRNVTTRARDRRQRSPSASPHRGPAPGKVASWSGQLARIMPTMTPSTVSALRLHERVSP